MNLIGKFQFVILSAVLTLISFFTHLYSGFTTMINGGGHSVSNTALSETIILHLEHPVFSRKKNNNRFN